MCVSILSQTLKDIMIQFRLCFFHEVVLRRRSKNERESSFEWKPNQTSKLATIFCPSRTFTFEKYDGRLYQRFVIPISQNFLDNNDMLCMD